MMQVVSKLIDIPRIWEAIKLREGIVETNFTVSIETTG
jgi:hypothetical protein